MSPAGSTRKPGEHLGAIIWPRSRPDTVSRRGTARTAFSCCWSCQSLPSFVHVSFISRGLFRILLLCSSPDSREANCYTSEVRLRRPRATRTAGQERTRPDLRSRFDKHLAYEQVRPPATQPPDDQDFYVPDVQAATHRPNVRLLRDHFFNEGRLTEQQALWILDQATTLLTQEPNMLQIDGPVTGELYRVLLLLRDPRAWATLRTPSCTSHRLNDGATP